MSNLISASNHSAFTKFNNNINIANSNQSPTISEKVTQISQPIIVENPLLDSLNFLKMPGSHTIKSPVVGSRAQELIEVERRMKKVPILAQLMECLTFSHVENLFMPLRYKDKADEISRDLFLNYISKYTNAGCTEDNIVEWTNEDIESRATLFEDENEMNTWRVHTVVSKKGYIREKRYLPPYMEAYCKLMHMEETPLKATHFLKGNAIYELLSNIKPIILLDEIYKKIYGLKISSELDYTRLLWINRHNIKLGEFANVYRELEREKGNLGAALLSGRSIYFLETGRRYNYSPRTYPLVFTVTLKNWQQRKEYNEFENNDESKLFLANVTDNYYDDSDDEISEEAVYV